MTSWQASRRIERGDLVQGVIFATYQGRFAQLIRTGICGTASADQRNYVDVAIKAQEGGISALRPGRPISDAVGAVQDTVSQLTPFAWGTAPVQTRCGQPQGVQYAAPGVGDPFVAYRLPDPSKSRNVIVREDMRMVTPTSAFRGWAGSAWATTSSSRRTAPGGSRRTSGNASRPEPRARLPPRVHAASWAPIPRRPASSSGASPGVLVGVVQRQSQPRPLG